MIFELLPETITNIKFNNSYPIGTEFIWHKSKDNFDPANKRVRTINRPFYSTDEQDPILCVEVEYVAQSTQKPFGKLIAVVSMLEPVEGIPYETTRPEEKTTLSFQDYIQFKALLKDRDAAVRSYALYLTPMTSRFNQLLDRNQEALISLIIKIKANNAELKQAVK